MKVAVSLQAAYLLHYTLYGDNNFIIDVFTLEHGRVPLMARGARSAKPRTRALYQPFRPLLISWMGDRELRTLTGIEESGSALALDGKALACAYYLNEILLRLLGKDQPQPALFAHYALALAELEQAPATPDLALRRFELQLLETLGLLPDFACCTRDGSAVDADTEYTYYPVNACAIAEYEKPANMIHADGVTQDKGVKIRGSTLLALAGMDIADAQLLDDIRPLMKRIMRLHLGDKPLNSRSLFESLTPPPPPSSSST